MSLDGNAEQIRLIAEQLAEAMLSKFSSEHPPTVETPPLVKWVVGAVAALGMAAIIGGGTWLVSSVGSMREMLARMDERMQGGDTAQLARDAEQDRRIRAVEIYHESGGPR